MTSRNEMNERSPTTTSTVPPIVAGVTFRTFVRSRLVTRSSARSRSWSWPCPTSSATTSAAPRWSRQSVNPPVDAPASSARNPRTSVPNTFSACSSFSPPRPTNRGGGPLTTRASPWCNLARRLLGDRTVHQHTVRVDEMLRLSSTRCQFSPYQLGVESAATRHRSGLATRLDAPHARTADRFGFRRPQCRAARTSARCHLLRRGLLRRSLLRARLLRCSRSSQEPSSGSPSSGSPSSCSPSSCSPCWQGPFSPPSAWQVPSSSSASVSTSWRATSWSESTR